MIRAAVLRFAGLFSRSRRDRDLEAEIASHLQLHIDDNLRAGMAPGEARRQALLRLGGADQTKEAYRDRRGFPLLDQFLIDFRHSCRGLGKSPGLTITALLTLAIGIGANTAIFSVIDAVMLKPLPYPHGERIVTIWEKKPNGQPNSMTTLNYLDYARSSVFERMAATTNCCAYMTLSDGPTPTLLFPERVSAAYFDVLGIEASLGRTFRPGDDTAGRDHVAILSHALWVSRFGSDSTLVGRDIHLDSQAYTVVGILPAKSPFDRMLTNVWVPLTFTPANTTRNSHWLVTTSGAAVGLLKPGVTLEQARAEMDAIASQIAVEHPETNKGWGVIVNSYAAEIVGRDVRQSLYLLWGSVAVVLLIGCVNLANLMLTRGLARQREISIKLALGATPARLVRQLLMESVLLSAAGAVVGLAVGRLLVGTLFQAMLSLPAMFDLSSRPIPPEAVVALDSRVYLLTVALSVLCAAFFGIVPAMQTIQSARADVGFGQRVSTGRRHARLRSLLIVAEVALATVLVMSATLLIRSLANMTRADVGFDGSKLITAEMPIRSQRFANPEALLAFLNGVKARIGVLPGVREVAFTTDQPLQAISLGVFMQVAGRPYQVRAERPTAGLRIVSGSYFTAMGLRLRNGRALEDTDHADTIRVAVINDTLARMNFTGTNPIGQHVLTNASNFGSIQVSSREEAYEIVGVVGDERISSFDDPQLRPIIYLSNEQHPSEGASNLVVRTTGDPSVLEPALRRAVAEVDPDQALSNVRTISALLDDTLAPDRLRSALLGAFSGVALLLATIGIYGVTSYSVRQRQHEMSIRLALGASPANLVRLVVGNTIQLAAAGLALGCVAGLGAARLLRAFLFGVRTTDGVTLTVTIVVLASIAALASFLPARRAGRVNPIEALRTE